MWCDVVGRGGEGCGGEGNTLYLNVNGKLDYETISSYTVRLRCLLSGVCCLCGCGEVWYGRAGCGCGGEGRGGCRFGLRGPRNPKSNN